MNSIIDNALYLEEWKLFDTGTGVLLMHEEGDEIVKLIEITNDHDANLVIVNDEPNPCFDAEDAWTITRAIHAMQISQHEAWTGDRWTGVHRLLPIRFENRQIPDLPMLATLVFFWHTNRTDWLDESQEGCAYVRHIHFQGKCWLVSISGAMEFTGMVQI